MDVNSQQCKPPLLGDQWIAETELAIGELILPWLHKLASLHLRLIQWLAVKADHLPEG